MIHIHPRLMPLLVAIVAPAFVLSAADGRAETFTVAAGADVEDVVLRDRAYAEWNYGAGHLLEAGFMPGLYEIHHASSLIRFNLSRLPCVKATSAKLRLYKPNDYIQTAPVTVHVHAVAAANAAWAQGAAECEEGAAGATWARRGNGKLWAGAEGCAKAGVDYLSPALDTQVAPDERGKWLEFELPAELVQSWLENPGTNAGLVIRADADAELGAHAFFYASEHYDERRPELVIEGVAGEPLSPRRERAGNPRKTFPTVDAPQYERWLEDTDGRYGGWAKGEEMAMTKEQGLMPYYWDIVTRAEILCPKSRIPLMNNLAELDELIAAGDEEGVRAKMREARAFLLIWEYVRQTCWYDSGPIAEALSPRQLGVLWGKPKYGIFAKIGERHANGWFPEESEAEAVEKAVESMREKFNLAPELLEAVAPVVRKHEALEWRYRGEIGKALEEVVALLESGNDGPEMFRAVKRLHFSHEMFLYHQSLYNTPRWSVLIETLPPIAFAKVYLGGRRNEYAPDRIMGQYEEAMEYLWKGSRFAK
jgi:hypothetical protein